MALSLSAASAPHLDFEALEAACKGRGLGGVELVVSASPDQRPEALVKRAKASGLTVTALRAHVLTPEILQELAQAASELKIPISVPHKALPSTEELKSAAEVLRGQQVRLFLGHGSSLESAQALVELIESAEVADAIGIAWELRPSTENLGDASAVLFAIQEHLGLVRLYGGGPEQHDQDGSGIGKVLVELALAQYRGDTVLLASSDAELPRWSNWLASRKPGGCGTAAERKLEKSGDVVVDVRPVEPRDRLDTIMGAYRSLKVGATLRLTLDHDPSCMYHLLDSTEPEGSFEFKKTADGPVIWKAEVTRR